MTVPDGLTETATERGDRVQRQREDAVREEITKQARLAVGYAGWIARDAAAGNPWHLSRRAFREKGLDSGIADFVERLS